MASEAFAAARNHRKTSDNKAKKMPFKERMQLLRAQKLREQMEEDRKKALAAAIDRRTATMNSEERYIKDLAAKKQRYREQFSSLLASEEFTDYRDAMRSVVPWERDFYDYLSCVMAEGSSYLLWTNQHLEYIPSFMRLFTQVSEVNLSNTRLETVDASLFTMPALQRLYLGGNKLATLPPVSGSPKLQILDLHSNQLTELPSDFGALTDLRTLDLERNKLRKIRGADFAGFLHLDFLNLAHNSIRVVPPSLGFLEKLMNVSLHNNPVINLPPNVYQKGTSASLAFLRNISSGGEIHPSTLASDMTRLLSSFSVPRHHLSSHPHNFLCNLLLRAKLPWSPKHSMQLDHVPVVIPKDEDNDIFEHPVHDFFVAARCRHLAKMLQSSTQLPIDEKTQLPVLSLELTPKQLSVLVKYLYTDSYTPPPSMVIPTSDALTQEAKDIIAVHNQRLREAWLNALFHASEVARIFKLNYLDNLVTKTYKLAQHQTHSTYATDMKNLYKYRNDKNCDLTFVIAGSEPVYAHKAVLCARSQYFNMMLTGGMVESQSNVVTINEDPGLFNHIIEFCYTDDIEEFNPDTVIELLAKANLYGLDRLVGIVGNTIGYSLDIENVCGILISAAYYSIKPLAKACYFYLLSNYRDVKKSQGWKDLTPELSAKIARRAVKWGITV